MFVGAPLTHACALQVAGPKAEEAKELTITNPLMASTDVQALSVQLRAGPFVVTLTGGAPGGVTAASAAVAVTVVAAHGATKSICPVPVAPPRYRPVPVTLARALICADACHVIAQLQQSPTNCTTSAARLEAVHVEFAVQSPPATALMVEVELPAIIPLLAFAVELETDPAPHPPGSPTLKPATVDVQVAGIPGM